MSTDFFNDLEFVKAGQVVHSPSYVRDRYFDYYGLQFLYAGGLSIQIGDGPRRTYNAPGFFVTFPGVRWNYEPSEASGKSHIWICFRGERVTKYISSGLLSLRTENCFRPVVVPGRVLQTMEDIMLLSQEREKPANHQRAVWLLEGLLLDLSDEQLGKVSSNQYREEILQLRRRIISNPEYSWNFAAEAKKLYLSEVHFRRLFKLYINRAPGNYLLECRLLKAQELLAQSHLRIEDIALQCGFGGTPQLRKLLQKYTGFSPRKYRENMRREPQKGLEL